MNPFYGMYFLICIAILVAGVDLVLSQNECEKAAAEFVRAQSYKGDQTLVNELEMRALRACNAAQVKGNAVGKALE